MTCHAAECYDRLFLPSVWSTFQKHGQSCLWLTSTINLRDLVLNVFSDIAVRGLSLRHPRRVDGKASPSEVHEGFTGVLARAPLAALSHCKRDRRDGCVTVRDGPGGVPAR